MPIYEYQCESCGHRQDALQRMSDDPLVDCAACGQPTLKKLISAPRFRLKGSGWYETDFKSDNRRNLAEGDNGAPKDKGGESKAGEAKASGDAKKPSGGDSSSSGGDKAAAKSSTASSSTSSSKAS
ncbi:MAG: zinc ribbon domain-containing protein [Pseudomonadota bacterium]